MPSSTTACVITLVCGSCGTKSFTARTRISIPVFQFVPSKSTVALDVQSASPAHVPFVQIWMRPSDEVVSETFTERPGAGGFASDSW